MTRMLPPGVEIAAMPADFTCEILDNGKVMRATVEIEGVLYEIGLRPKREREDMVAAAKSLTQEVWQLLEFHRIGRDDLMAYAHPARHTRGRAFTPLQLD